MKFCGNCGNPLKPEQKFCHECGEEALSEATTDLTCHEVSTSSDANENSTIKDSNKHKPKSDIQQKPTKTSKKNPLILSLVFLILIGAGIGVYMYLSNNSTPATKMITQFEEAINNNDTSTLMNLITTLNEDTPLSEFEISNFSNYLSKNSTDFNSMLTNLKNDAEYYDKNGYNDSHATKTNMAYLSKIDDSYKVVINTSGITIKLPTKNISEDFLDDVTFFIDNTEYTTEKVDIGTYRINSLIPAEYEVTAKLDNELISVEDTADIDIFKLYGPSTTHPEISLLSDKFKSVKLSTNAKSATLYINGKEIKEFVDGTVFAPITKDMKLHAVITSNGEDISSEEIQWDGTSSNVTFTFEDDVLNSLVFNGDEETEKKITSLISKFKKNYAKFVTNKSYKYISSYVYPGSTFETSQKSYLESIKKEKFKQTFVSHEIINTKISEDKKEIIVTVDSVYDITVDNNKVTKPFTHKYKISYYEKSKKYLISDLVE